MLVPAQNRILSPEVWLLSVPEHNWAPSLTARRRPTGVSVLLRVLSVLYFPHCRIRARQKSIAGASEKQKITARMIEALIIDTG